MLISGIEWVDGVLISIGGWDLDGMTLLTVRKIGRFRDC